MATVSPLTEAESKASKSAFAALGVCEELCEACVSMRWKEPTPIQVQAIPELMKGSDVVGLAQTGSGKTGTFALPILQSLLKKPSPFFALVLAPTRELAIQTTEQFESLGACIGLKVVALIGGVDMMTQAIALGRRPHVLVGTPGRVVDHIANTKGFSLKTMQFLVLDEADKLLELDFEQEIDQILSVIPKERRTLLFSATMTSKVQKLQRACLNNPVKVEVATKYSTVDTLRQQFLFVPQKFKDTYLLFVLNELSGSTAIMFTRTCDTTRKLALMLRNLGFGAVPIHGQMTQPKRLASLNKFKAGERTILVATDVAARGLDIPSVDLVVNYDVPTNSKDYVHRVGRTARAGRSGRSITLVTQYDIELFQKIEKNIGRKMEEFGCEKDQVLVFHEKVCEAQRIAVRQIREADSRPGGKRKGNVDDDEAEAMFGAIGKKFRGKQPKAARTR